ncbi:probable 2-oxoglutarate-dependent dioxygenase AOP1 isoform X2 [Raphanus sativus]|uniref:Probable 2-oxoglutarate-dependent dioxygenase AOP1 isoform X2 n=1 Tax=Raphanus sativus TaxID=3726 RepID=A0A9W3DDR1_RAPSA|nr:probable 2-oxoglutarate-dependent dioxygenase AOP1 isoform X2 [Raphanus sativus]
MKKRFQKKSIVFKLESRKGKHHQNSQNQEMGTSKWDKVKADVRKALEDYGCFEALFPKVSYELDKSVFEAIEELFGLPIQAKERNVSPKPYHGYLSRDLYESLGIDDANLAERVNDFTQQLWPDHGNKRISETMHGVSDKLAELDVMVRRMILESFGIEKYIDEHLDSTNYLFRMMKYTPPPPHDGADTKLGLPCHTDKNIMTILHQYQIEGLEIQTKDEKWFKVKPSQHFSFIVMVGDSMCAFLNGRLSSTYHRVLMTAKKTRYTTALFSTPKTGVIIDSAEELIDEEHPRVFKPFEFNDYRDFYNTEDGYAAQSTLHAFCAL